MNRAYVENLLDAVESLHCELECGKISQTEASEREAKLKELIKEEEARIAAKYAVKKMETKRGVVWYAYYYVGKKRRMKQSKSREGLVASLMELEKGPATVADYFELAMEDKRLRNLSTNSIERYKKGFASFFGGTWIESLPIRSLTREKIQKFVLEVMDVPEEDRIIETAAHELAGYFNFVIDAALDRGDIDRDPRVGFDIDDYRKLYRPKKDKKTYFTEEEVDVIVAEAWRRTGFVRYSANPYVLLLSRYTGERAAELCALKWEDVDGGMLHIHRQQLSEVKPGGKEYYEVPWTKDERGVSKGGRYFPITEEIAEVLRAAKEAQEAHGIASEYVFPRLDGEMTRADAYETFLRRFMASVGIENATNHTFRRTVNTELRDAGVMCEERARVLGHSPETNQRYYSPPHTEYVDEVRDALNKRKSPRKSNVLDFGQKKKALEARKFGAF